MYVTLNQVTHVDTCNNKSAHVQACDTEPSRYVPEPHFILLMMIVVLGFCYITGEITRWIGLVFVFRRIGILQSDLRAVLSGGEREEGIMREEISGLNKLGFIQIRSYRTEEKMDDK